MIKIPVIFFYDEEKPSKPEACRMCLVQQLTLEEGWLKGCRCIKCKASSAMRIAARGKTSRYSTAHLNLDWEMVCSLYCSPSIPPTCGCPTEKQPSCHVRAYMTWQNLFTGCLTWDMDDVDMHHWAGSKQVPQSLIPSQEALWHSEYYPRTSCL